MYNVKSHFVAHVLLHDMPDSSTCARKIEHTKKKIEPPIQTHANTHKMCSLCSTYCNCLLKSDKIFLNLKNRKTLFDAVFDDESNGVIRFFLP